MSIVVHLHQLFNADTCQSYIHTLRWKDRVWPKNSNILFSLWL